jgi:ATP-dependent helicase HepA
LQKHGEAKVLAICKTKEQALATQAALAREISINSAVFHEDMTLMQRDRAAVHFADDEGARILICSEIGSEGRNFQFAHHLALLDLPENPELLEQRIGRLDRIGQTRTVQVHKFIVRGTLEERIDQMIESKTELAENIIGSGEQWISELSTDQLRDILTLRNDAVDDEP